MFTFENNILNWTLCINNISISLEQFHFSNSLKTLVKHNFQGRLRIAMNYIHLKPQDCQVTYQEVWLDANKKPLDAAMQKDLILATGLWGTKSLKKSTAHDKVCFCKRLPLSIQSYHFTSNILSFVSVKSLGFLQKQIMITFQFLYLFYYKYIIKENQSKYSVN